MGVQMQSERDLVDVDPEVAGLVADEVERQSSTICLIPSDNYVSRAVLDALGSVFTNKYSEGYAGRRYYGGQQVDRHRRLAPSAPARGSRQGEDRCRAWGDHEAVRRGRGRAPPSRRDGRERLPPYAIGDVRRLRRVDHIDRLEPWILYVFEQRLAVPE
jgi:hypothetical protein